MLHEKSFSKIVWKDEYKITERDTGAKSAIMIQQLYHLCQFNIYPTKLKFVLQIVWIT